MKEIGVSQLDNGTWDAAEEAAIVTRNGDPIGLVLPFGFLEENQRAHLAGILKRNAFAGTVTALSIAEDAAALPPNIHPEQI